MKLIRGDITDPYFNIAAEEYFLRNAGDEYFLVYVNKPSVIIGKHQNAYAEINYSYIKNNNIPVVRRISGGGAVWHDQGNLNFAFIRNGTEGRLVNFRRYMQPVLDFLIKTGLNAVFSGKNAIDVNGFKISGNAEHVFKNRVLHHGTLLFNTNLKSMEEALKASSQKYLDKSVKSVRARTANIVNLLNSRRSVREFGDALMSHIMAGETDPEIYDMKSSETQQIKSLAENKYSTWDWNFGYSPSYRFYNKGSIAGSDIEILLDTEKARIKNIRISGNLFEPLLKARLESALKGQKHEEKIILGILEKSGLNAVPGRISSTGLAKLFF